MSISERVKKHLDDAGLAYETVAHPRATNASRVAQAAHIPGDRLAKTVVIHHEEGYVLAVVPASRRIDLSSLQRVVDRRMGLASEDEVARLFDDCDMGAVPPLGAAYGLATVVDECLDAAEEVFFEGGDHTTLVKMAGADFQRLMAGSRRAAFSRRA